MSLIRYRRDSQLTKERFSAITYFDMSMTNAKLLIIPAAIKNYISVVTSVFLQFSELSLI